MHQSVLNESLEWSYSRNHNALEPIKAETKRITLFQVQSNKTLQLSGRVLCMLTFFFFCFAIIMANNNRIGGMQCEYVIGLVVVKIHPKQTDAELV